MQEHIAPFAQSAESFQEDRAIVDWRSEDSDFSFMKRMGMSSIPKQWAELTGKAKLTS
jgi:hypothetical protein